MECSCPAFILLERFGTDLTEDLFVFSWSYEDKFSEINIVEIVYNEAEMNVKVIRYKRFLTTLLIL